MLNNIYNSVCFSFPSKLNFCCESLVKIIQAKKDIFRNYIILRFSSHGLLSFHTIPINYWDWFGMKNWNSCLLFFPSTWVDTWVIHYMAGHLVEYTCSIHNYTWFVFIEWIHLFCWVLFGAKVVFLSKAFFLEPSCSNFSFLHYNHKQNRFSPT